MARPTIAQLTQEKSDLQAKCDGLDAALAEAMAKLEERTEALEVANHKVNVLLGTIRSIAATSRFTSRKRIIETAVRATRSFDGGNN